MSPSDFKRIFFFCVAFKKISGAFASSCFLIDVEIFVQLSSVVNSKTDGLELKAVRRRVDVQVLPAPVSSQKKRASVKVVRRNI